MPRFLLKNANVRSGRDMARIELFEATAQTGRRYEIGEAAAPPLAAGVAVNPIDPDRCGALRQAPTTIAIVIAGVMLPRFAV